ncbi:hypothetical protein [Candidatus Tisiphia endosymbiont of Nemotelus uliginosus]|uniref:hypothetical protein n=1 Tax=Candidatus Tisiphia endosymbiont of Nemotelus uliginosus TaxID=3077926 RepID=UPI0035C8A9FE
MPTNNTVNNANVSVMAYFHSVGGVSSSNHSIPTSSNYQNKAAFSTAQHKENTTFSYTFKSQIQHYHNGTHHPPIQHLPAHNGAKAQPRSQGNTTIVKAASTSAIHKNLTPKMTTKDQEIPVRAKLISASYNISKHDHDSKVNISNINPLHYKLKPSIKYKNISEAQSNNTIVNSHQPINATKHQKTKGQKLNKDSELRLYLKHEYDHDNNHSKLFNTTYVEPIRVKKILLD